jgi:hypothetical protein
MSSSASQSTSPSGTGAGTGTGTGAGLGLDLLVGLGRCCSPRHRMPGLLVEDTTHHVIQCKLNPRLLSYIASCDVETINEGSKCVSMTWRATALADVARHIIGCQLIQYTRVQTRRAMGLAAIVRLVIWCRLYKAMKEEPSACRGSMAWRAISARTHWAGAVWGGGCGECVGVHRCTPSKQLGNEWPGQRGGGGEGCGGALVCMGTLVHYAQTVGPYLKGKSWAALEEIRGRRFHSVGPGGCCSPRHSMSCNSTNESSECKSMTWRASAGQILLPTSQDASLTSETSVESACVGPGRYRSSRHRPPAPDTRFAPSVRESCRASCDAVRDIC